MTFLVKYYLDNGDIQYRIYSGVKSLRAMDDMAEIETLNNHDLMTSKEYEMFIAVEDALDMCVDNI